MKNKFSSFSNPFPNLTDPRYIEHLAAPSEFVKTRVHCIDCIRWRHLWPGSFSGVLKDIHNSFKKWPIGFYCSSSKTIMVIANVIKFAVLKYSILQLQKQLLLLWLYCFNYFTWQTLTDDFWELIKNKKCPFPLDTFADQ